MFFIKDFVEKKKKSLFIYERLPKPDSSKYT